MESELEELQFLGVAGIYAASTSILRGPYWPLFTCVAATLVLPLSALFLLHVAISHAVFTHIDTDDTTLDSSAPSTDAQHRLLSRCGRYTRLASNWLALLLFKVAYLLSLLLLSLHATAAAVFSVASIYSIKHNALTFLRVLSIVPRRRLVATFLMAFALLFAYHAAPHHRITGLAGLLTFLLLIAYLVGLIYISVVWHLASVVSVLEDYKGLAAMRKRRDLIRGPHYKKVEGFFLQIVNELRQFNF
uniref:Uncharacterized protein n=1 Tax=Setaria viridis TaxID=4556 RepID=A0A4U6TG48_SETVI|nr:LOW QUALITY PROTEIN: hypothetical protein SEVIR_8G119200v2 [Setaria viridis]